MNLQDKFNELVEFVAFVEPKLTTMEPVSAKLLTCTANVVTNWARELQRQIESRPGKPDNYRDAALSTMLALALKADFGALWPELKMHKGQEPKDLKEYAFSLLLGAIEALGAAQREFSGYLPMPEFPGLREKLANWAASGAPTAGSRWVN